MAYFILGLIIGLAGGVVATSVCSVSHEADDYDVRRTYYEKGYEDGLRNDKIFTNEHGTHLTGGDDAKHQIDGGV